MPESVNHVQCMNFSHNNKRYIINVVKLLQYDMSTRNDPTLKMSHIKCKM